ncbi:hypothetical protein SASPL_148937 [Salvia splendens]|uniref:Uncharacterized protein n=1 Tax=Salvia splendens TaxID=180675 RepID=A0A8X8W9Z0_SALSN|nr:hypothetical protein SASPL_148937 [Salvia splendens]
MESSSSLDCGDSGVRDISGNGRQRRNFLDRMATGSVEAIVVRAETVANCSGDRRRVEPSSSSTVTTEHEGEEGMTRDRWRSDSGGAMLIGTVMALLVCSTNPEQQQHRLRGG